MVALFVTSRILSSIIKGCAVVGFFLVITVIAVILVKSTSNPVDIYGLYTVDNFSIERTQE